MSSLSLVEFKLDSVKKLATVASPLVFAVGAYAEEKVIVSVRLATASAGIGAGNEVTVLLEQSWDDSASWQTVPAVEVRNSSDAVVVGPTGIGTFTIQSTSSSGNLSPLMRLTLTPPSGETFSLTGAWKLVRTAY